MRARLVLLVLACMLPATLAVAMVMLTAYREGRAALIERAQSTARSMMTAVDHELVDAIVELQALATSPFLMSGDLMRFHAQARLVVPHQVGNVVVLSDADGQQLVNTLLPYGEALPRDADPGLRRAFEAKKPMISDLFHRQRDAPAAGRGAGAGAVGFSRTLEARLEACRRDAGCQTVFFIDIDGFKLVNDGHGHAVGDELLRLFAARLRAGVRERDVAARLGGDEFAALIHGLAPQESLPLARALIERLSRPYAIRQHTVNVSACIGIAGCLDGGASAEALLEAADAAMYRAKAAGKGSFTLSGSVPL